MVERWNPDRALADDASRTITTASTPPSKPRTPWLAGIHKREKPFVLATSNPDR